MMKHPSVYILLSTYNGARFLREQIDSIIGQDYHHWRLLVRDDGSSDNTLALISELTAIDDRIHVTSGKNLGVIKSFCQLLREAPDDPGGLFAFCDQDDVWLPDKLSRAVKAIEAAENPLDTLYFAGVDYVDCDLHPISKTRPPRFVDFGNAVIENIAIGCTMMFGNGIRKRILAAAPEDMLMHDWWAYLTATAFGKAIFDDGPCLLYRQHGSNVSMWESSSVSRIRNRLSEFLARWQLTGAGFRSVDQAARFVDAYGDEVPAHFRQLIAKLLQLRSKQTGLADRVRFALSDQVHRNRRLEDWVAKVLIVARRH